jgi:hypothetical protein
MMIACSTDAPSALGHFEACRASNNARRELVGAQNGPARRLRECQRAFGASSRADSASPPTVLTTSVRPANGPLTIRVLTKTTSPALPAASSVQLFEYTLVGIQISCIPGITSTLNLVAVADRPTTF